VVVFAVLVGLLWLEIVFLNSFTSEDVTLHIRFVDVLIGLTIYLKTSIDFALYMGKLMVNNRGWKNRIAIEIGTAAGNAIGTMAILAVWVFFKEIRWLLALMIFLAALILFKLAEESLEYTQVNDKNYPRWFKKIVNGFEYILETINKLIMPVLRYIVPNLSMQAKSGLSFWSLFGVAFTVPFILGLDDFAGYVPLFSVVNLFGFAIGALGAHMLLNIFLYISPDRTTRAVKNPIISFLGSVAFAGIGILGLIEVIQLIGE